MNSLLRECIDNFGPPGRDFSFWQRMTYNRVSKPAWLRLSPSDKLSTLFSHMNSLFRDGVVVWGHIVQANYLIFSDGPDNVPGELVYSLSNHNQPDPNYLQEVAARLGELKGTYPSDPACGTIAEYLTDEMIRVFGLSVPYNLSPEIPCRISTTYFVRKHLPGRKLCQGLLPIIVNPQNPMVAMPLPERYWPQDLITWWKQSAQY